MKINRISGVLAHPTSFPGRFGIGDLGEGAYSFIDFLHKAKQSVWQVLPLNPTSFGDSPYQSFSTFAGNTLLISLELLLKEGLLSECDLENVPEFDERRVDYGAVMNFKKSLFKKAYENFKQMPKKTQFSAFCKENKGWLDDYCLFVAIKFHLIEERRYSFETPEYKQFAEENKLILTKNEIDDYFYGAMWLSWDKAIADRERVALKLWKEKLDDEINYEKFLQFTFFKQWRQLKTYANAKHISIIGDIPIFVALDSADVWCGKELFKLDAKGYPTSVAGVPPDYFSETGQLWGNPLYDWTRHKATGYEWWISRIEAALKLADIIRIDHFRGFDSYWSVKYGEKTAIKGVWLKGPGRGLFAAVKSRLGRLPIIAEDLGIITEGVEKLRDGLGLPGMKILQFGFLAEKNAVNIPHNFSTANVAAYTGTHDNDTTLGWYKNASPEVRDQFRRYLNVSGDDPAWDMMRALFASCAETAVVPVQDVMRLDTDARMNYPGKAAGNWRFRYTADMLTEDAAEYLAYLSDLYDRNTLYDTVTENSTEDNNE